MKVWIDVLTPKQLLFFRSLAKNLGKEHDVLVTTRSHREVTGLMEAMSFDAMIVGRHGGATLKGKLEASVERMMELVKLVVDWKPDVAVSFSSPECARVSYGLAIPHLCVNDSPHAEKVARLALPLATHLASPWVIPFKEWSRFGIRRQQWTPYHALDPAAWLKNWLFNRVHGKLGLSPDQYIVFRPETTEASQLANRTGIKRFLVIQQLCNQFSNYDVVIIPRYDWQAEEARKLNIHNLLIIDKPLPSPDLLVDAALFVGMGGTMNAEAILLGVPAISLYPDEPTYIDRFLMRSGLLQRAETIKQLLMMSRHILEERRITRRIKTTGTKLLQRMEDPTIKLQQIISSLHRI